MGCAGDLHVLDVGSVHNKQTVFLSRVVAGYAAMMMNILLVMLLAPSKIGLIKKENASFITDIIIFLRIAGLIKTKDDSGIHCSKAGEAPV